jgi:hypothetical protein
MPVGSRGARCFGGAGIGIDLSGLGLPHSAASVSIDF